MIAQAFQTNGLLTDNQVRQTLFAGLERQYRGQKVLVLISDHTRSVPLPLFFRDLVAILHDAKQLDFMVALGAHPPLTQAQLDMLVGITAAERSGEFKRVRVLNHRWDLPGTLTRVGTLPQAQIQEIAGNHWHPTLGGDADILNQPRHPRLRPHPYSWPHLSPRSGRLFRRREVSFSRHFRRGHDQHHPLARCAGRCARHDRH